MRMTSARSSTARASRSARGTTARCPSWSVLASRLRPARRSRSTTTATTSTGSWPGSTRRWRSSVDELQELYRQVILDHNRDPRNFGELADATRVVAGVNPLCGDKMTLYVKLANGKIADIRFQGTGCAISVASSSLMTERVKGAPVSEALELFDKVHELLTSSRGYEPAADLDKLAALGGVREYPSRVKCASLGWHALKSAVADDTPGSVTTE